MSRNRFIGVLDIHCGLGEGLEATDVCRAQTTSTFIFASHCEPRTGDRQK